MKHTQAIPKGLVVTVGISLAFLLTYIIFYTLFITPSTYAHIGEEGQAPDEQIRTYLKLPFIGENNLDFLPEAERSHMTDVKRVFNIVFILAMISLGILVGMAIVFWKYDMKHQREELLGRGLATTGWILLGICFLFGISALLSFDKFWVLFHVFLFPQGNWLFGADSILIQLYPGEFFQSFTLKFFMRVLVVGIASVIIGRFIHRMDHHRKLFLKK